MKLKASLFISIFSLCSTWNYGFFNSIWWVDAELQPLRQLIIFITHILFLFSPLVVIWLEKGE